MGTHDREEYITREEWNSRVGFDIGWDPPEDTLPPLGRLFLFGCFLVVAALLLVPFCFGLWLNYEKVNHGLPNCEEDEVLYPLDYTGPGDNVTTDYICIHSENIEDIADILRERRNDG